MNKKLLRIANIVGARPQFIKVAPVQKVIQEHNHHHPYEQIQEILIHTGQHYDYEMSQVFFEQLGIKKPDYHLGVGSGTHGYQTGEMIKKIEEVLIRESPDIVIVYGDTNSTLAGALAATKLHIPVAHVEAGLRSFNKKMPEEINRVLTDHCSSILFCPTETAVENLKKEGFINIINNGKLINPTFRMHLHQHMTPFVINVGDVMYDAMLMCLEIAERESKILKKLNLEPKKYVLSTIHRAENTGTLENLKNIFEALAEISKDISVILPIHPRTKKLLSQTNALSLSQTIRIIDPVSYFDMLILEKNAYVILTDSGGVQKEAYWLKVPCITLREETEWAETVEIGANTLVGSNVGKILENFNTIRNKDFSFHHTLYGDGKSAERTVEMIIALLKA